jgi:hypothetical protein
MGCRGGDSSHTALFQQLFPNDTSALRGVDPRDSISVALRQEDGARLRHRDELGLAYRYEPRKEVELLIDYHSDNLRTEQNSNHIASIVANIMLEDEVETAKLYNEVMAYFNRKYGVSGGNYGALRWKGITRHLTRMDIHLRMHSNRRGLTINFVDTEPFSQPEPFDVPAADSLISQRPQ